VRVKERLFLDRIALDAADIAPRHAQTAAVVEANFADPDGALGQRTLMPAGVAAQTSVRQDVVQLAVAGFPREHLGQCGHDLRGSSLLLYPSCSDCRAPSGSWTG